MVVSILIWWLVVQVFALVGMPWSAWLFRSLPDRGYAQAKAFGLLITGFGAWILAMFGLAPFHKVSLILIAALAGGLGWYAMRSSSLLAWLRSQWRLILSYEVIFLLALIFIALIRSTTLPGVVDPNPYGTERPMDFAFFNTIQRSNSFPPPDPWLAGYSINYYYFGYLLMAMVALLSGIAPGSAYNLSLALCFALTALGIAGVVWNLIALSRRAHDAEEEAEAAIQAEAEQAAASVRARPKLDWLPAVVIALAIVTTLVGGNMAGALQVFLGDERSVAINTSQFLRASQQALSGNSEIFLPSPLVTEEFRDFDGSNMIGSWERKPPENSFSSWWSSRALWDDIPAQGVRRYAITEFPAFSFMLGDMHPHVLALPYGVLALALSLSLLASPSLPRFGHGRGGWADLVLSGLILGCLYVINTWDMPGYILLYIAALLVVSSRLAGGFSAINWKQYAISIGALLATSIALFLPFYITFRSFAGSQPTSSIPILGKITGVIGLLTTDRSELFSFLLIFAIFALAIFWLVLAQWPGLKSPSGVEDTSDWFDQSLRFGPLVVLVCLIFGFFINFQLFFLLPLGLYATAQAFAMRTSPALSFAMLVAALGCFICFGTEVIYIRDVFEGWQPRFNTIFKFYYQIWLIWGTLSGFALWWLYSQRFSLKKPAGYIFSALFLACLWGVLVYPQHMSFRALAEGERTGLEGRTRRETSPAGIASIEWLRKETPNESVILEAIGHAYDVEGVGAAQVSAATGLPTVLGWANHESQWRNGSPEIMAELPEREQAVETIYSSPDIFQAQELLSRYKVRYVYIGGYELQKYGAIPGALDKFAQIGDIVFQQDEVTIYQIR
jgi:YYY domain-containing protein